ncbi:hypothetical protein Y032_0287g1441 [Ancylostoma ceylanicum]|nr:hypothetical protein Y032_0287g1441 [Ancylostoma ceylanicum]
MFVQPFDPFPRPAEQPSPTATRRLQRDFQRLLSEPIDGIIAMPNEENILEWHYVIKGSPDTPYEGGFYYGKLVFQPDFPWKPPAICMLTPNGRLFFSSVFLGTGVRFFTTAHHRFVTNTRLCLSISDYHPESWNPGWTVSAILVGLHSFMNEETYAAGVLNESNTVRRKYANDSIAWNLACPEFKKMFPTMFEELAHENGVGSSTPFSNRRTVTASEVASTSVDHRSALSQRSAKKRRADTNVEENSVRPHLQPQMRKVEVIELSDGE